ncbi:MAG: hypothetical protein LBU06_05525 [Desulfovibrio sp.]|jgi:hypothetical protein|nr:hypothetical protein [Desulfovibrio sp.]
MKKSILFAACTLILLILLGACSATQRDIANVHNTPYGMGISKEEAARIITAAGLKREWQIKRISPNLLEGTLINRNHKVVVSIPLTETGYSILYKSSEGMKTGEGTIHRAYNRWVVNLEKDINLEMTRYSLQKK